MTPQGPLGLPASSKGGVFFLYGDDEFRKEEEALALVAWHLDPATRDFNLDLLRGSEVTVETLASVLSTPPMMAEWRVVLLREAEALASDSRARKVLTETAAAPPSGLAFIIVATIPKGSRAALYKELQRKARSFDFREIGPNDVPGWLMRRAADRHGREMTVEAARALAGAAGTNLGVLAQEVAKLSDAVEEGEPIGLDAVRRGGTLVPEEDRWEWMDRVGSRDLGGALAGLQTLMSQGESGVGLTIGLATHLIRLGAARAGGRSALDGLLPPHQKWLFRRLMPQADRWSVDDLEEAILGLRKVDRLLKSSQIPEEHVLEGWLLGLMARERGEAR